jgi:hypothetical protein
MSTEIVADNDNYLVTETEVYAEIRREYPAFPVGWPVAKALAYMRAVRNRLELAGRHRGR